MIHFSRGRPCEEARSASEVFSAPEDFKVHRTAEGNDVQIRNPLSNATKKEMTPFDPAVLGGIFVG